MSKNKQHLTIPQNNKKNTDYQKQSYTTPTNMNFSDILNNSIGKTACSILKLGGYIIIFYNTLWIDYPVNIYNFVLIARLSH